MVESWPLEKTPKYQPKKKEKFKTNKKGIESIGKFLNKAQ